MNNKQKIITGLIAGIIGILLFLVGFAKQNIDNASLVYQIFLNGSWFYVYGYKYVHMQTYDYIRM